MIAGPGAARAVKAGALVIYTGLAVALFSGAWVAPTTSSLGLSGDAQQIIWFLGWPSFALAHGQNPLFTNYIDYPAGVNLMWNTTALVPALALAPIGHLAGFVLAYNVLMTAGVALSAWTAFLLIRRFASSSVAAGVGGLLYGFSPFMTAHSLGHSQLTVAFMPPVLLIVLDEIVRVQHRRPLVSGLLLGVAAAAQLLIGEELLAMAAVLGLLLLCLAAGLYPGEVRARLGHAWRALACAAIAFTVLVAVPVGFQFFGPQRLAGRVHAPNLYVSDALSFLVPTRLFLVAPSPATAFADKFTGNTVETTSYVGILLLALLAFISIRMWHRQEVRLAALGAVLVAILSMGVTIHVAGKVSSMPVFVLGLIFPLLQRYLPGRLMLYLTFGGWLALSRLPILNNILPSRLMIFFYLLAGLLIAAWLSDMKTSPAGERRFGLLAVAAALLMLVPALPFPSTPNTVPRFFASSSVQRIPAGSVALVIPYSSAADARAMLWQLQAGMDFRMPEGYAFIPDAPPRGWRLSPPPSATQAVTLAIADGRASPLTDETRLQILGEWKAWDVKTVVVGPMAHEQEEVDFVTGILGRSPEQVDGVYVWWGVDLNSSS